MSASPVKAQPADHRRSLLRQERSRQTRRNITRAAVDLWSRQAFDETTVDHICADAGVGRTTFYFHFSGKDELLAELGWATADAVKADLDALGLDADLDRRLHVFVAGTARRIEKLPRHLAERVIRAALKGVETLGQFPGEREDFGRILASVFRDAHARGTLRPGSDPAELGAVLAGMIVEGMLRWVTGNSKSTSLAQVLQERVDLVLNGILVHRQPMGISPVGRQSPRSPTPRPRR